MGETILSEPLAAVKRSIGDIQDVAHGAARSGSGAPGTATTMFRDVDMRFWLQQAEAEQEALEQKGAGVQTGPNSSAFRLVPGHSSAQGRLDPLVQDQTLQRTCTDRGLGLKIWLGRGDRGLACRACRGRLRDVYDHVDMGELCTHLVLTHPAHGRQPADADTPDLT